jgi:GlpG protein
MRPIGQLEAEQDARVLADYLFVQGIETQLEPAKGSAFTVWVVDEDRVAEARALLSRFRSMPDAEEFHQASRAAEERRREAQKADRETDHKLKRAAACPWLLGGGGLTTILISLCIVAALLTRLEQGNEWVRWFRISNGLLLDPARFWQTLTEVAGGQVWRLFTPVFLHFSLWHLLFNLLWLQSLGRVAEGRIGTWRFAGLVALVAVASNLSQYVAGGAGFGGMSGVVYGLFGYLWVRGRVDSGFGEFISPSTSGLLLIFLALGVFGLMGPTANAAHFSGLVAGGGLGWLAGRWPGGA